MGQLRNGQRIFQPYGLGVAEHDSRFQAYRFISPEAEGITWGPPPYRLSRDGQYPLEKAYHLGAIKLKGIQ